jgi:hypothetical protein
MPQPFTQMIGLVGLSLFLANFAPDAVDASIAALQPRAASPDFAADQSLKADRVPVQRKGSRSTAVSSVELAGVGQVAVIFRDRVGQIVYRSDPLISTTVVSKNADIPNLNIQEIPQSPTATQWRLGPDHKEGLETSPKRSLPAGCEGVVSPLVKHEVRRVPGLCLVSTGGIPHA